MSVWACVVAYLIDRCGWPLLWITTVALAACRVGGVKGAAFQAAAHVFVGALVGAAAVDRIRRAPLLGLVVVLSMVEVACFVFSR